MYYALIDMRSSSGATTALAWGSMKDIADTLIYESNLIIENYDNLPIDVLESEYYCEFDDYNVLKSCENHTKEMITNYSFVLDDCTIVVGCLVEGYSELVIAWDEYKADKWTMDCWSLVPEIEETDETLLQLDDELRSLNEDFDNDEHNFFIEVQEE